MDAGVSYLQPAYPQAYCLTMDTVLRAWMGNSTQNFGYTRFSVINNWARNLQGSSRSISNANMNAKTLATYLDKIAMQEELTLDTPVNRSIKQNMETLKSDQFSEVAAKAFACTEREVDNIVESCKSSRSIQVLSQRVQQKIFNFRAFQLPE